MNRSSLLAFPRRFCPAYFIGLAAMAALPVRAATGDLVAICYNSDGNDDFALMALANIPGGSRLFISDNGWSTNLATLVQEGGSPSPNGQIQLDVAAGGIPFGTVLKFDQSTANVAMTPAGLGTLTMVARFPVSPAVSGKLSFGSVGDQIMVYQTAGNTVGGAVTMVSAFSGSIYQNLAPAAPDVVMTQVNGWQVGPVPQNSQSAATSECNAPGGLVVYNGSNASTATALGLASFTVSGLTGVDNYKYNGPFGLADKAAYLTTINNPANWVANDTVPYDLSGVGPGPGAAEINITGNATNIADGSPTPLVADHTLFGSMTVASGTLARTFTIQNVGTANLTIPAGAITFSGTNAAEFTASGITLPAVIAPAGSTTFVVTFDPAATGFRNATVNIVNDDSNENPYNFSLQGFGYNYTAPAGAAPPFRWSSAVQNTNVGSTRAVGSTTTGDIIAATKINTGNAGNIRVTRHVGQTGAVSWTRDLDSGNADDVNDMFVDPATGDAYIAARASLAANLNWFVHKVNGNGTAGWTYTFDGTVAGIDECFAIARASDGNIVAAGMTSTASGNLARVARINASTGAEMNVYTNATNFGQFNGLATDGSGNTYATGFINDPANGNGLTVKLNSTLGQIWAQTFDGAALFDSFSNVTVLPNGDCAVGGTTRGTATNTDAIVIRYASASPGTEVWRRAIVGASGAGSDTLNNLTVDAAGDLYAAGSIANTNGTDRSAYIGKVTNAGALAWTATRLGSAPDSPDRFQNVRVSGGAVYAVGAFDNANRNILISRFNAGTGAEEWTTNFNGSGNGTDDVFSGKNLMTLLGTNALALGGDTFDVSGNTFGIVLKYAPVVLPTVTANTANVLANAASLVINGTGFDLTPANNTVAFTGAINGAGTVTASTGTQLTVTLNNPTAGILRATVANLDGNSGASTQVANIVPVVTANTANLASNAATITISGFGFSPTPANNTVVFNNGAAGNVTAATTTSLSVTFTSSPNAAGSLTAVVTSNTISSGAPVQVATVSLVSALVPWRTLHGLAANGTQDYENPSKDGVANLLKYAFNTAPNAGDLSRVNVATMTAAGTAGLPLIVRNASGQLAFTYLRRKAATLPDIIYMPEVSTNLSAWTTAALTGGSVTSINATWERVTGNAPAANPRQYGRVQICRPRYQNDFTAVPAASLRGTATWVNQSLRQTEAINGQFGSAILDGVAACEGQTGFDALFTVAMGPGTAPPADGMSFTVGDPGTLAFGEDGPLTPHSLTIALDTYDNGIGQIAAIGIRITVNGTMVAYNATNPYTNGATVPVEVSYTAATGVTVRFNGAPIFTNVPVPAFTLQAGDRYGFGGRTGGLNQVNVLDNVTIAPR